MKGWKTWAGVIASVIYAIYGMAIGTMTLMDAMPYFIGAWTAAGLGHKIEKAK